MSTDPAPTEHTLRSLIGTLKTAFGSFVDSVLDAVEAEMDKRKPHLVFIDGIRGTNASLEVDVTVAAVAVLRQEHRCPETPLGLLTQWLYLADRVSMVRQGRTITGATYRLTEARTIEMVDLASALGLAPDAHGVGLVEGNLDDLSDFDIDVLKNIVHCVPWRDGWWESFPEFVEVKPGDVVQKIEIVRNALKMPDEKLVELKYARFADDD